MIEYQIFFTLCDRVCHGTRILVTTYNYDPEYCYETLLEMKTFLHRTLSTVPYFKPKFNEKGREPTCAIIGGISGSMVISAIYVLNCSFLPKSNTTTMKLWQN